MSSRLRREQLTVGREEILLDTLDHLRSAADRKSKHHFLFLGPRGIGKSHLLAVVEDRIAADPRLAHRIVVARFPEESVRTLSFADMLKQLVAILTTNLSAEPEWKELSDRLVQVEDSNEVIDLVVPALRRSNEAKKRTIVVMIENLNELFSKQIRQDQQIGAIRKFFMDKNGCLLIATAPMHFDAVTDVAQPFYDFFDTQTLQPFNKEQALTLFQKMRTLDGHDTRTAKDLSHCVMALHDMTGGNPRLMVMTCEQIVREGIESAKEILLRLVDRISPTYQASLAEMAPQERALMETLASIRDTTPRTPANVASKLGISERQTSALLKRLSDSRLVTFEINPDDKRSRSYSIRDRFLDIWLAVQAGDASKRRICALAALLESFYSKKDGPFLWTGAPNRGFTEEPWPPTTLDFQHLPQSTYLSLVYSQITDWVRFRIGEAEELAIELNQMKTELSEKSVSRALLLKIRNTLPVTENAVCVLRLRLTAAYLHFLTNEDDECLRELESVLASSSESTADLAELAQRNIAYLRARVSIQNKNAIRYPEIFISYAWGDSSLAGKQRQNAVERLCDTLNAEGIPYQRDNDELSAGASIREFMDRLSKGDKIIAIISEKYLLDSESCILFELFRAFRRKGYEPEELQKVIIPIVLDDAKKLIQTREGRISVAENWHSRALSQKERLRKVDPRATSSVEHINLNDMMDMVARLPDMLAAINDIRINRFKELSESNFAELLMILRGSLPLDEVLGQAERVDQAFIRDTAARVGAYLAKQLEEAALFAHTTVIENLFFQSWDWLNSGGMHAHPSVRRCLYVRLANALLLDFAEKRIPNRGLDDAFNLLDLADREIFTEDIELDALTIATKLMIDHLQGDDTRSLDELKAIDHPAAFANRVRLLYLRERLDEAFELVHHSELDVRWAEIAAAIYVRRGRFSDAVAICESMRNGDLKGSDDPNLITIRYFRCLMIVADEYSRLKFPAGRIRLDLATDEERRQLAEIRNLLGPIVSKVFGAGRVSNGIELQSLEIAFNAAQLTGDSESASGIAKLLASANPISKHVAHLVRSGFLEATADLVSRLKADWPKSIEVSINVCELTAFHLDEPVMALNEIDSLERTSLDGDQKLRLAYVLLDLYQCEVVEVRDKSFSLLAEVLGADHYALRMAEAISAIRQQDWALAERLLNERPAIDDPHWLRIRATVLQRKGELRSALSDLKRLCEITSSPENLRSAVTLALKIEPKEFEFAISILERLARFPGERRGAEQMLAEIGWESGTDDGLRRAAQLYIKLYQESPNEPDLAKNAAICLRSLKELDQAISILEDLERHHPYFVEGYLLHADLLETQSRAEDAFDLLHLESVRTRFWNELIFLHKYMHLGYVTAHELEAHNAMSQIRIVEEGKPEQERTLQVHNLDHVVEIIKGRRQFSEQIDEMMVRGQAPWTLRSFQEHAPILSAWAFRTQKLTPWETNSGRANFCTYASNGFFSKLTESGDRELESIEPPIGAGAVVADISSLITLHKLGLLEKAADYFGLIYLPSAYRELELFDAKKLHSYQLSRIDQSRRLFEMLVRGQLRRPIEGLVDMEVIDFQTQANPSSYSVGDVVLCLAQNGHIAKSRHQQLAANPNFGVSGREGIESLLLSNRCQFTLFALQTLESAGLLNTVVELYRVTLTEAAVLELEQEHFAFEQQANTARESRDLWRSIRDNNKFQYYGSAHRTAKDDSESGTASEESSDDFRLSLASYGLAKERCLPLLADDRVLLAIYQNESNGLSSVAFSTLELLSALETHDSLSLDDRLEYTLQLIKWRYRFVKVDLQLLLHAAKIALESGQVPGYQLKLIATYVQDCMLDLGLFGGIENVTPRVSIALELYAYWTRTVSKFINQLWTDASITDEKAETFTRWAIDSLLPTSPISVRPDVQVHLSENQAKLVLVHVLSERGANPSTARSAKLISVLQNVLGLSYAEFCTTVFGLMKTVENGEGSGLSQDNWSRVQRAFQRSITKHALSPFNHDGNYEIDARGIALLEASNSLRARPAEQTVPEHVLNVLNNLDDEYFIKTAPSGPLVFHRQPESSGTSMFEAADLLIHPNSKAREAVASYFSQLSTRSEGIISEKLRQALKIQSKKVSQKRAVNWYPAAESLFEVIANDWQLNLAGFRQVLFVENQGLIHHYWLRCIRPGIHPAYSLPLSSFHACSDIGAMKDRVLPSISKDAVSVGIISAYLNHLGHLPLVDEWSLQDVSQCVKIRIETEDLLKLANHVDYFTAFHSCAALVARWGELDRTQQIYTAKHLSDFICLSRDTDLSTNRGRLWICLNRLANHFLEWTPLYGPELGEDHSASLAWWMAARLAHVVCEDVERKQDPQSSLKFTLERNIEPVVHFSSQLNQLIRGGATRSVFHANTSLIQHGGPFFASLIASFKLEFRPIYSLLSEQAKAEVDAWMAVNSLHQAVGMPQEGSALFANYVADIQTTNEQWEQSINLNDGTRAVITELRADCARLTDSSSTQEILSAFASLKQEEQALWLDRMKAAVWRKAISLDPILSLLRDSERTRLFVRSMKLDQLSMAIELLLSIQQYGGLAWKFELPHRLVDWLNHVDSVEEKSIIFNGIMCSSVAGESPSAIDRVRERDDFVQLKGAFAFQEDRLESARTIVPRWTWSKFRIYLEKVRLDSPQNRS